MRLSKIRIAGFKSFVDPVTLHLPNNLVGILGPNGCGKSNTIDAVRWVMGESSAKNLRGQSMDDVIFNGSSARKPVGLASVELVFDNSAGKLAGPYANYAEIALKRQVSRDGTSKFFLNGSRCRRRDITDIFLGTGLGPRSYAIIEQGMISRLIEAKPDELRTTLEEAAGISRYKERRRETETRIQQARENLERLDDLRQELSKQLQRLDKQAKAAERFCELRDQQRRLQALSLAEQWQKLQQTAEQLTLELKQTSTQHQAELSQVRQSEAQLEQLRLNYSSTNEQLNQVQAQYYELGAEVSRISQTIQHQQASLKQQKDNLDRLQDSLKEAQIHQAQDQEQLSLNQNKLQALEPDLDLYNEQLEELESQLVDAEQASHQTQVQWQQLQQALAQPLQRLHSETARIEQLEKQVQQNQLRSERLKAELEQLERPDFANQLAALDLELAGVLEAQANNQTEREQLQIALQQQQIQRKTLQTTLHQQRSQLQTVQGQLAALNTLQQAALKQDQHDYQQYLQQHQLHHYPNLAQELQVENGWEFAVETVLAERLNAICVDDLAQIQLATYPTTGLVAVESSSATTAAPQTASLASKVLSPSYARSLLQGIWCCASIEQALAQRQQLLEGHYYISPAGIKVGTNWLQTPIQATTGGILERQHTIRALQTQLEQLHIDIEQLEAQVNLVTLSVQNTEQAYQQAQLEQNRWQRAELELKSRLQQIQQRQQQVQHQETQTQRNLQELTQLVAQQQLELAHAEEKRMEAEQQSLDLQAQQTALNLQRERQQSSLQSLRQQLRHTQQQQQQIILALQQCQTAISHSQQQLARGQTRLKQLVEQRAQLLTELEQQDAPLDDLELALTTTNQERSQAEQQLYLVRQRTQQIEHLIRQQEQQRSQHERQAEQLREALEKLKLLWQTNQVQTQHVQEQLEPTGFILETLFAELAKHPQTATLTQELKQVTLSIERLGAINLAAIEEYREQNERKVYLDQQNDDLVLALETLETAMRKIDRETRARFKETFDLVNQRLQEMFPRLFGGGECHLAMTDSDLLTTGISIMARPPGKRLSSIHLMSGGEKALTAVALVFAIFELNPAPFCMLDEVDAPLDEANVGRFCELVKQMSERVQFIFITHNKTTMELAENLIGVTMREAGVSRLVAVDMTQALQLANE